jgi:uncharacterized protein (DUF952 family)
MNNKLAYKILRAAEYAELQATGLFAGAPNDLADGFIHLSTADQLPRTLARYFANADDLYVTSIDLEAAGSLVKWEASSGGDLYPHLYAPMTLAMVVSTRPLETAK